jgi:thioredoxin 1
MVLGVVNFKAMKGKFDTLIDQNTPVLIDFYADWCGPCQAMTPVFKEVAAKYDGKVKIIKIDVDKNQPLAQRFGIRSIPTMMLFKQGKELWKKAGMMTGRELSQLLDQAI